MRGSQRDCPVPIDRSDTQRRLSSSKTASTTTSNAVYCSRLRFKTRRKAISCRLLPERPAILASCSLLQGSRNVVTFLAFGFLLLSLEGVQLAAGDDIVISENKNQLLNGNIFVNSVICMITFRHSTILTLIFYVFYVSLETPLNHHVMHHQHFQI